MLPDCACDGVIRCYILWGDTMLYFDILHGILNKSACLNSVYSSSVNEKFTLNDLIKQNINTISVSAIAHLLNLEIVQLF